MGSYLHCMANPEVAISNPLACSMVDSDFYPSEGTFGKNNVPNVAMG